MTPKRQRLLFACFGLAFLITATLLVMDAFRENLVFFFTPSELESKRIAAGQRIRIGGLVEAGSIRQEGESISFVITDLTKSLQARFTGIVPALFREGQGVVAEGYLESPGLFRADKLLAKHDENYMPPEVAEALKKSGKWQHNGGQP